jgi:hypothetical protein
LLPFGPNGGVPHHRQHASHRRWLGADERVGVIGEKIVSFHGDRVCRIKFRAREELSGYLIGRTTVRRQRLVTLDHGEDRVGLGAGQGGDINSNRQGRAAGNKAGSGGEEIPS